MNRRMKCQSPNVQRCDVAYDQGTSKTTTRTTGTAYSRGTATGTGAAVCGVTYSGQHNIDETHSSIQRTAFAERAAPPANPIVAPLRVLGIVMADPNDDGRLGLLVYCSGPGFCDARGCTSAIVMATAQGSAGNAIHLSKLNGGLDMLRTAHHGMHDLHNPNDEHDVWQWNGKGYVAVRRQG